MGFVWRRKEGGEEAFTGRAAIGYDHGYDAEVFYLGLALDPAYVEGFVERCLETVHQILQAECEVLPGRPLR